MASVINTNIASLYAQKNLSGAQSALSTAVERLSSGLRINRAKDDAAGLGISENIKQQIGAVNQGIRNANDAISMVQTAEGSLSEVSSILQRMKELSVQARNDSLSTVQRTYISDELVALKNEINSIAERTTFNDIALAKNGLRTAVSTAVTGGNVLRNGAAILSDLTVSGLSVSGTNAGSYTLASAATTALANQISEGSGANGQAQQLKTITVAGKWNVGDTITASVEIEGSSSITALYTVSAGDLSAGDTSAGTLDKDDAATLASIAKGLAAALNKASQAADGPALGISSNAGVVTINAASDAYSITTTATESSSLSGSVTVASGTLAAQVRDVYINEEDAAEGNKFILSVNGREYSVVATDGASATAIRNQVATDMTALLASTYQGSGIVSHVDNSGTDDTGHIQFAAGAGLGDADISLRVVSLRDGQDVKNMASAVSEPSKTTAALDRTITLNNFDIMAGRKATVTIGTPDSATTFSTIMSNSDTETTVAARLQTLINATHGNTSVSSNVITIDSASGMGMFEISLTMNDMVEGAAVEQQSSVAAAPLDNRERTLTINQNDLSLGNVVSVSVNGKEYATKVGSSDTVADVTSRLVSQLDDDFARVAGTVSAPTVTTTQTGTASTSSVAIGGGLTAGQSLTLGGLTFTANSTLTATQVAVAFSNLQDGATSGGSTSLGTYSGQLQGWTTAANTGTPIVFTATVLGATTLSETDAAAIATQTATAGTAASTETATLDFSSMTAGDSLTIAGLKFTANRDLSAAEAATAFSSLSANATSGSGTAYGNYSGTFSGWSTSAVTGTQITATSSTATTDVTNIDATVRAERVDSGVYVTGRGLPAWDVTFKDMADNETYIIGGLTFTAEGAQDAEQVAAAFAGYLATTNSNTIASASSTSTLGIGQFSGTFTGYTTGSVEGATVRFTGTTVSSTAPADTGTAANPDVVSVSDENVITFGKGSNLGSADISVSVKSISDAGKFTLTANDDTGVGGLSQTVDMGTIAAGGSKLMMFDKLGVTFTLNNARDVAVGASDFEVFSSAVNTLSVDASGAGSARFQVGASTRDVVDVDGFKDIRITGYNKNSGEEASVFDRLYATLNTIAANTTESLSSENFATLENQIEDVITTVADFRSYFGAQQNRIEFAISNLQAQSENLTAANSRIRDTDYAAETATLTKTQIMQQAATAMLAQANQMPNVILALLK